MENNVVPKNIFIDMDGVLVDFPSSINDVVPSLREKCRSWVEEDPENNDQTVAFCSMIFAQNLGQYLCNSATAGNDWTI